PVHRPLVQKMHERTNGNAPPLGGGRLQETLSAAPLRAQSNVRLPRTRSMRERGAHGCHRLRAVADVCALTRASCAERASTYRIHAASRRQRCSRKEFNAISDETEN